MGANKKNKITSQENESITFLYGRTTMEFQKRRSLSKNYLSCLLNVNSKWNYKSHTRKSTKLNMQTEEICGMIYSPKVIKGDELILRISIHMPQKPEIIYEQFSVLGSQFLTELWDCITCVTNELGKFHSSFKPPAYTASFLCMDDWFLLDTRNFCTKDYNKLSTSTSISHRFKCQSMEKVRFKELISQFGSKVRGIFCHHGSCEHLMSISDIRMWHPQDDPHLKSNYPQLLHRTKTSKRKCNVCLTRQAKQVTYNDKEAICNPMFFCEDCYERIHFAEGKPIYNDFLVFPCIEM